MLYKATPDELKLVMVDQRRLELGLYEDIPHLLAPVVPIRRWRQMYCATPRGKWNRG